MKPLRIVAKMAEPVVYWGDGIHLDGILAAAAYRDLPGSVRDGLPSIQSAWAEDFDLPLARWACAANLPPTTDPRLLDSEGRLWGWRASAVHAVWLLEGGHEVRKKPAIDEMVLWGRDNSVLVAGGPYKAKNNTYPARQAGELVWWVVGDRAEVLRLLRCHITHIGKFANHGAGRVLEWSVEPAAEDRSVEHAGLLRRNMPAAWSGRGVHTVGGIRAPYHHLSRRVDIRSPLLEELTP